MTDIRIDELPLTLTPKLSHAFAAMSDGVTVQLTLTQVLTLLGGAAPELLNTVEELSAALGDDENFAANVTASIAGKLPLTGGTMTGVIDFGGFNPINGSLAGSLLREPQLITASDPSFALHPASNLIRTITQGGGGGGGGATSINTTTGSAGVGGDAGDTIEEWFDVSGLDPKTIAVIIGSGGSGGIGLAGGDGSDSSITVDGVTITANGGLGGIVGASSGAAMCLSQPAAVDNILGLFNRVGERGGFSFAWGDTIHSFHIAISGKGGGTPYGQGGGSVALRNNAADGVDGNPALGYGAGGSGATAVHNERNRIGGGGANGLLVIEEYS